MDLTSFGWSEFFEINFESYEREGYTAGRVAVEHKNFYRVYTQEGDVLAELSGKLRHEAANRTCLHPSTNPRERRRTSFLPRYTRC